MNNINKKYILLIGGLLLVSCLLLSVYKVQKNRENDYVYLTLNLKTAGDNSYSSKSFVSAEESYQQALKFAEKTILWKDKTIIIAELKRNLQLNEISMITKGFVLLDGVWVLRKNLVATNIKHRNIESSTRKHLLNAILYSKESKYNEASKSIYAILKNYDEHKWLAEKINLIDVYKYSKSLPTRITSPLHIATKQNEFSIVSNLLENGAAINVIDDNNNPPLLYALENGNIKIVELMFNKGVDAGRQHMNQSPFLYAIDKDNIPLIKLLIDHGVKINDNYNADYPIIAASTKGKYLVIEEFLKNGANINVIDSWGFSALAYSVMNHHTECTKLLLSNGATKETLSSLNFRKIPYDFLRETKLFATAQTKSISLKSFFNTRVNDLIGNNNDGLLIFQEKAINELQKLSVRADSLFLKDMSNASSVSDTFQSAATALSFLSFRMDKYDKQIYSMLEKLTNLAHKHNYSVKASVKGYGFIIILSDPKGNVIKCDKLTSRTPFLFEENNYLIMRVFSDLPGLIDAIILEVYSHLVVSDEVFRS